MNPEILESNSLVGHLTALRSALLRCLLVTFLLFPVGYWAAPEVITFLVKWSFPENLGGLHYFTPMEVFLTRLKLALILALAAAYPWNIIQLWNFLAPALYKRERKLFRWVIVLSSVLFFSGVAFCIFLVLPLLMDFSASFMSQELKPMLGLSHFLTLAGYLSLAFGLMFQIPVLMIPATASGLISVEKLRKLRPYAVTVILIAAGILTPPDVVSQLMLGVPSWLLFELGLLLAASFEKKTTNSNGEDDL